MTSLPSYNCRSHDILMVFKLDGGLRVALQAPIPMDTPEERIRLMEVTHVLEGALEQYLEGAESPAPKEDSSGS